MPKLFNSLAFILLIVSSQADTIAPNHATRMKAGTDLFKKSIRPALIENCLKCHGDEKVRSGLDISTRELLLEGGETEAAINLEKPEKSYLLSLIRHEEEPEMPPKKAKLPDSLVSDFQKWIALGAPYDKPLLEKKGDQSTAMQVTPSDREFWSFKSLADPKPPVISHSQIKNDLDHFTFAKLAEKNLTPNPQASDSVRIRRAYLSVIGLPPSPQQLKDALSKPHAELIDELLASPHYGERWARHWLDAARFAESHGFEQDYDRKFAYHYRDFVIKALNSNMPWDQFIRWQLAGDEIAPSNPLWAPESFRPSSPKRSSRALAMTNSMIWPLRLAPPCLASPSVAQDATITNSIQSRLKTITNSSQSSLRQSAARSTSRSTPTLTLLHLRNGNLPTKPSKKLSQPTKTFLIRPKRSTSGSRARHPKNSRPATGTP